MFSKPAPGLFFAAKILSDFSNHRACVSASVTVQELCESRGGRPGLPVITSLLVSVDVKLY